MKFFSSVLNWKGEGIKLLFKTFLPPKVFYDDLPIMKSMEKAHPPLLITIPSFFDFYCNWAQKGSVNTMKHKYQFQQQPILTDSYEASNKSAIEIY